MHRDDLEPAKGRQHHPAYPACPSPTWTPPHARSPTLHHEQPPLWNGEKPVVLPVRYKWSGAAATNRNAGRRLCSVILLLCVIPFLVLSLALPLVAANRIAPKSKDSNLQLPAAGSTITATFIFAICELFVFAGALLAYVLNTGLLAYRRRIVFISMGLVAFEAIATGGWILSRAIHFEVRSVCTGALEAQMDECKVGLGLVAAMGAVRFGYAPLVLVATLIYPGPWTKSSI